MYPDNAYVAGLKEELGFEGNELVQLQTFYIIGAVTGQIPFFFLLTYIPLHWLIPFLDIAWGIFTLLQFRVNGYAELAVYRFLVGWFEAAFFPVMHYLFGEFKMPAVVSRRTMSDGRSLQVLGTGATKLPAVADYSTSASRLALLQPA